MHKQAIQKGFRSGFTLIEILVVLVIMGFLVAMVAPKLAGITDSAVGTTDDTNLQRLSTVLGSFAAQHKGLPNGYINMLIKTTDGYTLPTVSDNDKSNGAEFLSAEFVERFKPQVHFLNADEIDELVDMGVKMTRNLATVDETKVLFDAHTDASQYTAHIKESLSTQQVGAGMAVMMAGVGYATAASTDATWATGYTITNNDANITQSATLLSIAAADATSANDTNSAHTFVRMDEGKHIGRILMGLGNFSELVNSGMLEEAGVSPKNKQMSDQYTWGNYVVALPRLQATMDRLETDTTEPITKLHILSLKVATGEKADGRTLGGRTPGTGCRYFVAQNASDVLAATPEGHTWGSNTESSAIVVN